MQDIRHSTFFLGVTALILVVFSFTACSTVAIQKVAAQKASYYKFSSEKSGLKVSIDSYVEEERLKTYFGCDLLSKNILPVLVVIENISSKDGFMVLSEQSNLILKPTTDAPQKQINASSGQQESLSKGPSENWALLLPGSLLVSPLLMIAMLPVVFALGTASDNAQYIIRNIEDNRLVDKTVYIGGSNSGFLYFKLERADIARLIGVQVALKNLRTNEVLHISVY
jgi:hypothetical protein